ncbi:hypothetical protein SKAU_G00282440 [Synaphobranchus kaupii]|uniref:CCHC-type domain-containing protein n=1 Tax=Synaphobranchus kaupii TaxID=118154 RepID=A0A9Q1EXJ4_SYNKA|nr:hypothetical protein SKAU_G00282440 [Synaphobranchus kaupii]
MTELKDLWEEFEKLQEKLVEQSHALQQAREEQRGAFALAQAVINQTKAPATVYLPRERKLRLQWLVVPSCAEEADVTKIFDLLEGTYGDKLPIGARLREFYDRKQKASETIRAYAYDLQEKISKVQRRDPKRIPDADLILKEQFILGLCDDFLRREMKRKVKEDKDPSFIQLMQTAITWSEEEEVPAATPSGGASRTRGVVNAATAKDVPPPCTLESLHEALQKLATRQEELFKAVQATEREQPLESRARRPPLKDKDGQFICYTCGQPGHTSRGCRQNRGAEYRTMPTKPNTGGSAREGGPASDVKRVPGPSMVSSRKAEWAKGEDSRPLRGKAFGDCLTIEVTIGGIKTNCVLDTGSEVTTISEPYYRKYFEGQESGLTSSKWVRLTAANSLDIPVLGCLEADIECMGKTLKGKCVFVLTNTGKAVEEMEQVPGIIGINVISELQGLFIQSEGVKRMDHYGPHNGAANLRRVLARVDRESQFVGSNGRIGYVKVAGRQPVTIPPFSEKVVEGRCRVPPKTKCQVLVEASQEASLSKGLLVANVLAEAADGRVPVRLLNSSVKAIKLPPRARLAELYKPQEVFAKELVAVEEKEGALFVRAVKQDASQAAEGETGSLAVPVHVDHQGLTPLQLQEFNKLLQKHSDVFSKDENDFGYTTTVTHSIHMGETHPIKQKHRRVPPQVFQEFKRQVQDLVAQLSGLGTLH